MSTRTRRPKMSDNQWELAEPDRWQPLPNPVTVGGETLTHFITFDAAEPERWKCGECGHISTDPYDPYDDVIPCPHCNRVTDFILIRDALGLPDDDGPQDAP